MDLALGPLLYYWPRAQVLRFYAAALHWPVQHIYLGEVVCARRHELRTADWLDIAAQCHAAGKTVVLSSQALLESASDLVALRKLAESGYTLEANDLGAVKIAQDAGRAVCGRATSEYLFWRHAGLVCSTRCRALGATGRTGPGRIGCHLRRAPM